jgi:hypothetical protein
MPRHTIMPSATIRCGAAMPLASFSKLFLSRRNCQMPGNTSPSQSLQMFVVALVLLDPFFRLLFKPLDMAKSELPQKEKRHPFEGADVHASSIS